MQSSGMRHVSDTSAYVSHTAPLQTLALLGLLRPPGTYSHPRHMLAFPPERLTAPSLVSSIRELAPDIERSLVGATPSSLATGGAGGAWTARCIRRGGQRCLESGRNPSPALAAFVPVSAGFSRFDTGLGSRPMTLGRRRKIRLPGYLRGPISLNFGLDFRLFCLHLLALDGTYSAPLFCACKGYMGTTSKSVKRSSSPSFERKKTSKFH